MIYLKALGHQDHAGTVELFVLYILSTVQVQLAIHQLRSRGAHSLVQVLKLTVDRLVAHKVEQLLVGKDGKASFDLVDDQLNVIIVKDVKEICTKNDSLAICTGSVSSTYLAVTRSV